MRMLVPREAQRAQSEGQGLADSPNPSRHLSRRRFIPEIGMAAVALCSMLVSGCGSSITQEPPRWEFPERGEYLTTQDNIKFGKKGVGLGKFAMEMSDKKWLAESPDFDIYEGHAGGYGDTLQIKSARFGIFLEWAYNELMIITLTRGWHGRVAETGIKLGDPIESFISAYTDVERSSQNPSKYRARMKYLNPVLLSEMEASMEVTGDENNKIKEITLYAYVSIFGGFQPIS